MFIDTHCHLNLPPLRHRLESACAAAAARGVTRFVVPGVSPASWAEIQSLASDLSGIFPAAGLHPMLAHLISDQVLDRLASLRDRVVAVGEIGLDYLLDVPRGLQQEAFRRQLRLAVALGLPVIVHCRKAFRDLLAILRSERIDRVGGVMHAFSGSVETARQCLDLGLYIGMAGPVTYPNAVRPVAVAREIPLEALLLETDAPDLTPEPHRAQANEPAFLPEIAQKIAQVRGTTVAHVADVTTHGAERLFRLPSLAPGRNIDRTYIPDKLRR